MEPLDKSRLNYIGTLAERHLYRAREPITTEEWSCPENTLILGNPVIRDRYVLVRNYEDAIAYFLSKRVDRYGGPAENKLKFFRRYQQKLPDFDVTKLLEFPDWCAWDYYQLVSACSSPKLRRPYRTNGGPLRIFEGWLLENIGEAAFFAQPDLLTRKICKYPEVYRHLYEPGRHDADLMMNLVTLPDGYPTPWATSTQVEVF